MPTSDRGSPERGTPDSDAPKGPPPPGELSAGLGGAPANPKGANGESPESSPIAGPERATPSDHDLIRRAQRGEEQAFQMLVERHQGRALRVARTLVGNREDADDLAQEAFLRVFRSLDRFDFQHEFTTWLYRIVTNLGIDHLRKRRPAVSTAAGDGEDSELDLVDPRVESPGAALERGEQVARVRAIIERLPPHFRSVLTLRELEGLPSTEIARIVGATHVTVRWRLHRGRKLFQEEWERLERLGAKAVPPALRSFEDDGLEPSDARADD